MIVDTHCHLHFDAFDADRDAVIRRAREFGVEYLVNVGTDPATNEAAWALASKNEHMWSTAGMHPHHAHEAQEEDLDAVSRFIDEKKPVAIGEIGLDYFKSQADAASQKKIFARMLRIAMEKKLPVIVHSREALNDTVEVLKSEAPGLRGVMHCFSYDEEGLKKVLDLGFMVSFTCNLTFKNAGTLLEVAKKAPMDRFMLETDAPYLAPQIYRGKRNEPCCLRHLVDFLAEQRGMTAEHLELTTTQNAVAFFGLGPGR